MCGYCEGLELFGLVYEDCLIVLLYFQVVLVWVVVEFLIVEKVDFDGIVVVFDLIVFGVIQVICWVGLFVLDDIVVVGYDNVLFGVYVEVLFSIIDQDISKVGCVLVLKLFDLLGQCGLDDDCILVELIICVFCGVFQCNFFN